jgi:type I restriction modification DNA specificity domain protein
MSEWKRYKLGELLRVKHGWAFKGEFFSDTGVQSILTPGNFYESGGFKANPSKDRFYSGDYSKEYLCSKGDLVVAMTEQAAGLLGSTAIVPEDNRYLHNQRIGLISCNESLNKDFAYYLFMTQSVRQQISRSASGTKVKHTSPEKIYDVQVDIPKIQTQKNIAFFLSSLDKKIQINNQINQELEAMAKTLYDYWFVQFDFPDQNGKPYKSSGGKMVYNPELKREIPEGWGVENLFDIADVQYGYPFSTDYFNSTGEGVPVIRIRDILGNAITNYSTEEVEDRYKINVGDVLIGMDGNFHMNYWIKEDCYLNQRVVKVNSDKLPNMVLKYQIEPFIKLREKSVSRTTVGHLSDKDLKAINVILPKDKYLSSIFEKFESLLENIIINQQQNQELTQLRDWLLPMLMNGQVKVE